MKSILNYTTKVSAQRSVNEITALLTKAKAQAILTELENGAVSAISFRVQTEFGILTFRLPARIPQVYAVLSKSRDIPPRLRTRDQAVRVAWRIVKDWLEAQLAMIEAGLADLEQVFLPYTQDLQGATLYERMKEKRFSGFLLADKQ